jgi:hypothetical protein
LVTEVIGKQGRLPVMDHGQGVSPRSMTGRMPGRPTVPPSLSPRDLTA